MITLTERAHDVVYPGEDEEIEFAVSFVEDMCQLVAADENGEALIIRTYLDETGVHDDAPVTAVSAYFSSADKWKAFTRRWRGVLRKHHAGNVFHMNDYAHFQNAFKGWDADRQRELGEELFPIIPCHTKFGVSVALIKADMEEIYKDYPHIREGLGTPYACCFQWLLSMVIERVTFKSPQWKLGCIHEDNHYKGEAIAAWDWVKESQDIKGRLGTLAFAAKEDCVPLQAADVLAWESQKRLAEPERKERKSFSALLKKRNVSLLVMNKQWLRDNAPRLDAMAREHLEAKR